MHKKIMEYNSGRDCADEMLDDRFGMTADEVAAEIRDLARQSSVFADGALRFIAEAALRGAR